MGRMTELEIRERAYYAYRAAIRAGLLVRSTVCEDCGVKGRTDGHHKNYRRPFDVRWLCGTCHRRCHKKRRRLQRPPILSPSDVGLGDRMRGRRKTFRMTMAALAAKSQRSARYLGAIERGAVRPGAATVEAIAKALDTTVGYLERGQTDATVSKLFGDPLSPQ